MFQILRSGGDWRGLADRFIESIHHMRKQEVPIKQIAKNLKVGVGTVYKVIREEYELRVAG